MSLKDFTKRILPIKDKLYRFSLRIVGNVAEAEDVVQEVLIKIWSKHQEMAQYQNVEAWCMKLTKNLSIDKLRSKHNRVGMLPESYELTSKASTPEELLQAKDTVAQIRTLIAELPEKQQMIIQLRDIEEMSYQEIAVALEISMDQVKTNLFRARKKIRAQLINTESYGL